MIEADLAEQVVKWLKSNGWEVYQEVQFNSLSRICDIFAVRNGDPWAIECKRSLGFAVLEQAAYWQTPFRSVAVASARNRPNSAYRVAEEFYKVGVIEVSKYDRVTEVRIAPFIQSNNSKENKNSYLNKLTELHKTYAKAGTKGGQHLTDYKMSMIKIKEFIKSNPGCTMKQIADKLGKLHYSSLASAKGNIPDALESLEKDWCVVKFSQFTRTFYIREIQ